MKKLNELEKTMPCNMVVQSIAVPFENSVTRVLRKFACVRGVEAESLNSTDSFMSAGPGRKTAYSNDLRWRIVYQGIAMNLPLVKIAQNLKT